MDREEENVQQPQQQPEQHPQQQNQPSEPSDDESCYSSENEILIPKAVQTISSESVQPPKVGNTNEDSIMHNAIPIQCLEDAPYLVSLEEALEAVRNLDCNTNDSAEDEENENPLKEIRNVRRGSRRMKKSSRARTRSRSRRGKRSKSRRRH